MVDSKPCFSVLFMCSKRNDPCWFAFGFACGVFPEAKVRNAVLIRHKLAVVPGGERFITKDFVKVGEVFYQMFKLLRIMAIPRGCSKPVDHPCVNIDADVKLDAIPSFPMPFDSDVVPDAAVTGAKSAAVNCNCHPFSSEEPYDSVHHLPDVFNGEFCHPSMNDTMTR